MKNINQDSDDDKPVRFKRSRSAKASCFAKKQDYRLKDEKTDDENDEAANMTQGCVNLIDDEAKYDLEQIIEKMTNETDDQINLEDSIDYDASEEEVTDEFDSFIDDENLDDASTDNGSDSNV